MNVDATTWSRDSHELFDYESRSVEKASFTLTVPTRMYRRGATVHAGSDRDGGTFSIELYVINGNRCTGAA